MACKADMVLVPVRFIYEGQFKDYKREGRGKETTPSGVITEGDFKRGKKVYGKMRWPNGCTYEGEFKNEVRHGKGKTIGKTIGTFIWASGNKYVGDFNDHQMHGKGVYNYTMLNRQIKYEGEFKNNKMDGKGILW
jgi:hypothetical protein